MKSEIKQAIKRFERKYLERIAIVVCVAAVIVSGFSAILNLIMALYWEAAKNILSVLSLGCFSLVLVSNLRKKPFLYLVKIYQAKKDERPQYLMAWTIESARAYAHQQDRVACEVGGQEYKEREVIALYKKDFE